MLFVAAGMAVVAMATGVQGADAQGAEARIGAPDARVGAPEARIGAPAGVAAAAATQKGGPSVTLGRATKRAHCRVRGPLPDPRCTPGATFTRANRRAVCTRGYAGRVRHVSASLKRKVYDSYGVRHHKRGSYEVDHLVSLELGGSNDESNLFPEAANPRPGFHEKDRLENRLHALVCDGEVSLRTAQRRIASDWLTEYRRLGLG